MSFIKLLLVILIFNSCETNEKIKAAKYLNEKDFFEVGFKSKIFHAYRSSVMKKKIYFQNEKQAYYIVLPENSIEKYRVEKGCKVVYENKCEQERLISTLRESTIEKEPYQNHVFIDSVKIYLE